MRILMVVLALSLGAVDLHSQDYLDVLRPFYGMSGSSGAESGALPVATTQSNALLGNPALLSYSERNFIAVDFSFDQVKGSSVFNSSKSDPIMDQGLRFNSISYLYPVRVYRGAWVWAFNLQPVNSFNGIQEFKALDTDNGNDFEYTYRNRQSGSLYALTAGTAWLVTMNTSLGFSASFLSGENAYQKVYQEFDPEDNFLFTEYLDSLTFSPHYSGFSARIGLSSELSDAVRVGAVIEFPARIAVTESSSQDRIEWLDDGHKNVLLSDARSALEYVVWGPWRIGAGLGFSVEPLEVSVNYRFHSYPSAFMKSNLVDSQGEDLDQIVAEEISQSVQNVHEFSASMLWSLAPLDISFAASLKNDPFNYHLDNIVRLDTGIAYYFSSGLGFTFAYRNEQWQSDLDHDLFDSSERKVEVRNSFSKFQFGVKFFL